MKKISKLLVMCLCVLMIFGTISPAVSVNAASRMHYSTRLTGKTTGVKKMKLKGKKLTIWGKVGSDVKEENALTKYMEGMTTYKKQTFTLSSKCKYYILSGSKWKKMKKSTFVKKYVKKSGTKKYMGMEKKNGKIISIYIQ